MNPGLEHSSNLENQALHWINSVNSRLVSLFHSFEAKGSEKHLASFSFWGRS